MGRYRLVLLKYLVAIVCIFSLISCKNDKNNEKIISLKSIIDSNIGKELIIPDSIIIYKPFLNYAMDSVKMFNAEIKIYSRINTSCSTCFENFELWENFHKQLEGKKIPILLICESNDDFEMIKYVCESGGVSSFPYPFILDIKNSFYTKNKFMKESEHFETVLTDKNNTILLLGSPIHSKEIEELYLKEIHKRIKQQ